MKKEKGILFFKTEFETLNLFAYGLEKGVRSLGIDTIWLDTGQNLMELGKLLEYSGEYEKLAAIDFNSAKFGLKTAGGFNVFESLGIQCINILVDHSYWYHDQLLQMPANGTVICVDINDMNYVNRYYKNIGTTAFMPHGGSEGTGERLRDIDVLYPGNICESLSEIEKHDYRRWDFDAECICRNALQHLLCHTDIPVESALEKMLQEAGIRLNAEAFRTFMSDCAFLERIVFSIYRKMALEQLALQGVNLTIYGTGWEQFDFAQMPNVSLHEIVPPSEVLNLMRQSKIVLNTMPWFKNGSHERVYNAMLNGAILVSEETPFLKETLPGNAWVGFPATEHGIREMADKVPVLLKDEEAMEKMRESAYLYAEGTQTWEARGIEICRDLLQW